MSSSAFSPRASTDFPRSDESQRKDRARALSYAIDQHTQDVAKTLPPATTAAEGFGAFLATRDPAAAPTKPTEALRKPSQGNPELFLREYVRTGNDAIEAAKRAGFPEPHIAGPRLLHKAGIKKALQAIRGAALTIHDLTAERVSLEVARVAYADLGTYKNPDGTWKKLEELTEDQTRAIAKIRQTPYGPEYTLHDKGKGVQQAMDLLGIGSKKVSVEHSGSIEHRVNLDALAPEEVDRLLDTAKRIEAEVLDVAHYEDSETL